ncbi:MAG: energy transducer TonB [Candidatus Sabulitectum sp.]|nr:energy transducer TonB [Candidatus Sabulitectum sp.]
MATSADLESREKSAQSLEWGIVVALAFLIIFFEFIPASELGRLSTRTSDSQMEAVEADIAFDDDVEEQEEEVEEEQEELQDETEELIEELDITLSLSDDTEGLEEALTIDQSDELADMGQSEEMGPPRFMAAEVLPVCTYRPAPTYPELASMAGVEGMVTLWIYVKPDGTVADVQLYASSGVGSLDEAAMSAAWNTRWSPARNNGVAVGVWTSLGYNFELSN